MHITNAPAARRSAFGRRIPPGAALLLAWAVVTVALVGCTEKRPTLPAQEKTPLAKEKKPAAEVDPATLPAVTVVDKAAYQQALDAHRGRIVLVDYWATWCDPCRKQFPHTVELSEKYRDRGLDCLSLSFDDPADPETLLEVRRFLAVNHAPFENLISKFGSGEEAAVEFDFDGALPHYVIYDREGKVAARMAPSDPTTSFSLDALDQKIDELLSQNKPD